MSDQGVVWGTRQRSDSESGHPRLNSTIIDNELVFNDSDLSNTRNNLRHQSQQIISVDLPEGYIIRLFGFELVLAYRLESCQLIVIKKLLFQLNLRIFIQKFLIGRQPLIMNQSLLMELILTIVY